MTSQTSDVHSWGSFNVHLHFRRFVSIIFYPLSWLLTDFHQKFFQRVLTVKALKELHCQSCNILILCILLSWLLLLCAGNDLETTGIRLPKEPAVAPSQLRLWLRTTHLHHKQQGQAGSYPRVTKLPDMVWRPHQLAGYINWQVSRRVPKPASSRLWLWSSVPSAAFAALQHLCFFSYLPDLLSLSLDIWCLFLFKIFFSVPTVLWHVRMWEGRIKLT